MDRLAVWNWCTPLNYDAQKVYKKWKDNIGIWTNTHHSWTEEVPRLAWSYHFVEWLGLLAAKYMLRLDQQVMIG